MPVHHCSKTRRNEHCIPKPKLSTFHLVLLFPSRSLSLSLSLSRAKWSRLACVSVCPCPCSAQGHEWNWIKHDWHLVISETTGWEWEGKYKTTPLFICLYRYKGGGGGGGMSIHPWKMFEPNFSAMRKDLEALDVTSGKKSSLHVFASDRPSFITPISGYLSFYIKSVDPLIAQPIALPCQRPVNSNAWCLGNHTVIFWS